MTVKVKPGDVFLFKNRLCIIAGDRLGYVALTHHPQCDVYDYPQGVGLDDLIKEEDFTVLFNMQELEDKILKLTS